MKDRCSNDLTSAQGKLSLKDLRIVFEKEAKYYPEEQYEFLIKLMQSYEMAYPLHGKLNEYILPLALPKVTPQEGIEDGFSIKDSLILRYRVSGDVPPDTITRFIVRHYKNIAAGKYKHQIVWRYGVLLTDRKGTEALVLEDGLEIRMLVKGKDIPGFSKGNVRVVVGERIIRADRYGLGFHFTGGEDGVGIGFRDVGELPGDDAVVAVGVGFHADGPGLGDGAFVGQAESVRHRPGRREV